MKQYILIGLLIFFILCIVSIRNNQYRNKINEQYVNYNQIDNIKRELSGQLGLSSRRITNVSVNGKLDGSSSFTISFELLPRTTAEAEEQSTSELLSKMYDLTSGGSIKINVNGNNLYINRVEGNERERTTTLSSTDNEQNVFVNPEIKKHIKHLNKIQLSQYNDDLDRYYEFDNNGKILLPPPTEEEDSL